MERKDPISQTQLSTWNYSKGTLIKQPSSSGVIHLLKVVWAAFHLPLLSELSARIPTESVDLRPAISTSGRSTCLKTRTEPQSSTLVPAQDGPSEKLSQHLATEALGTSSWERDKACRELSPAGARSASRDKDLTPPPSSRGKKKKKKSTRKKRRRSPSYSPSPVKKKKKKGSKKHKRHRSFSKKRRHSSSSPKSKRRDEKRHKKQSRSRPRKSHRHRHHHYPSRSQSSESRSSSCESR
ncbi:serine/arginine repetitive matrix protein 4 [Ursus arctos]|uniref:serine/arginine repetitive matrix protein 4 n=1 Tax=Ursus arctos TaxID=9644 RepID=UPI0025492F40|nr:serine/arginine repetitive matrix protein 4 [Ursus arctos]